MDDDDMLLDDHPATVDDDHSRTIIHIDIDCFYAQVEEIRDPALRSQPLGIQQKNIIVTSNYIARQHGVGKLMLLSEALKVCPQLVLVKGEDLTNYRKMSAQIFDVLQLFSSTVEKLGMDENYLDVTAIVDRKLQDHSNNSGSSDQLLQPPEGFIYPETESLASCSCGCAKRLTIASHLAGEIRSKLYTELGITCCAGIAHNKLMAKIVGARNKPNKQTILVPRFTATVLAGLGSLRTITGIGEKTEALLNEIGIRSIVELQDVDVGKLVAKLGPETASRLKDASFGRDSAPVRPSGKPKSISLEDSCKSISLRADVEEKFRLLLVRLINQVTEDGRIPIVIKIILRKFDAAKKSSHRETKQANILPSMFKQLGDGKIVLLDGGQEKLLKIVMRLFERSVDLRRPFNITLLGLAFSKFQEKKKGSRSIANFLIKKSDVEVQSITSLSSDGISLNSTAIGGNCSTGGGGGSSSSSGIHTTITDTTHHRCYVSSSPMHMDFESISDTSHASCSSDVSESEIEPSPKKTRIGFLIAKRRCLSPSDSFDAASPSKLRVGDLRLNSKEFDRDHTMSTTSHHPLSLITSTPNQSPLSFKSITSPPYGSVTVAAAAAAATTGIANASDLNACCTSMVVAAAAAADCPPNVDQDVFKELPMDVQQELLTQWRVGGGNSSSSSSSTNSAQQRHTPPPPHPATAAGKNNTLHRYFIVNKQR